MLALPQEYAASLCEVKSLSNDLLAIGRIIKIDDEAIEIAGGDGERMPLLQYRTPVKLFVYNARVGTRVLVGIIYLSTTNFVRVEEVKPLQDFERRGAFRVNTSTPATLSVLLSDEEKANFEAALAAATPEQARRMMEKATLEVKVMDISLTGMRLHSPVPLNPGAKFYIDFFILDSRIDLCLRVQRLIKMPNGDTQYGCTFFDFTERQMDALCKELFQLQRLEKNRRINSAISLE